MPIKLTDRKALIRHITIDVDGESCDVWYKPGNVTPKSRAEVNAATKAKNPKDATVEMLRRYVDHWDLLDETGSRIPPNDPITETLDYGFLNAVLKGITSDMYPDRESDEESSFTS